MAMPVVQGPPARLSILEKKKQAKEKADARLDSISDGVKKIIPESMAVSANKVVPAISKALQILAPPSLEKPLTVLEQAMAVSLTSEGGKQSAQACVDDKSVALSKQIVHKIVDSKCLDPCFRKCC